MAAPSRSFEPFGSQVAFTEPGWYQGMDTPHYTQSHADFRALVRKFVDEELTPNAAKWDEAGDYPTDLHRIAYEWGVYGAGWPQEYGGTPPPGGFDTFHRLILSDELARCGAGGLVASLFCVGIGLPPVLFWGSEALRDLVARPCITGEKVISLAITEPWGGSDVANIRTTATKSEDGHHWIVNGSKKFITGGAKASWFTTAVRTGGKGMGGISLLLIPADAPGITVRRLDTQGWWASSTVHIAFEDVKVPVEYLIGQENRGFLPIMLNFNNERFNMAVFSNRYSRMCLEDAISYATARRTFGKPLMKHQVIRHKIAEMGRRIEATHAMVESLAYHLGNGASGAAVGRLAAMCKVQATRTFEFCAREASQILGGASYQRSGPGARVERLSREVRVQVVGGGSDEIMNDLTIRMAKL